MTLHICGERAPALFDRHKNVGDGTYSLVRGEGLNVGDGAGAALPLPEGVYSVTCFPQ